MKIITGHSRRTVVCAAVVVALLGCQAADEPIQGSPAPINDTKPVNTEDKVAAPKMTMREQVAYAIRNLAESRGVGPESVAVVNARPVTWRSGALGCPKPGMNYTDALRPGVAILLRLGEEIVAYNAAVGGVPFPCPLDRLELPVYGEDSDEI